MILTAQHSSMRVGVGDGYHSGGINHQVRVKGFFVPVQMQKVKTSMFQIQEDSCIQESFT